MTTLFESPWPIAIAGALIVVILGGAWKNTGHKVLLYAAGGVIILFAGLVLLERLIKTDREKITATLNRLEEAIEQDEVETVVAAILKTKPQLRDEARMQLGAYTIDSLKIKIRDIEVEPRNQPPRATARFTVSAKGGQRNGHITGASYACYLIVTFYKENDGVWRIGDYKHLPYQAAFQKDRQ